MKILTYIAGGVAFTLLLLFGISIAMGSFNIWYTKTLKTQQADANREVFTNTASFVNGKKQELGKIMIEYNRAQAAQDSVLMLALQNQTVHQMAEINSTDTRLSETERSILQMVRCKIAY